MQVDHSTGVGENPGHGKQVVTQDAVPGTTEVPTAMHSFGADTYTCPGWAFKFIDHQVLLLPPLLDEEVSTLLFSSDSSDTSDATTIAPVSDFEHTETVVVATNC